MGAIPVPPKSTVDEHIWTQAAFVRDNVAPELAEAAAGTWSVWSADAAYFVRGAFLCCVGSAVRMFVRWSSGRRRFNVPGAWNATTGELDTVRNDTRVPADTMAELLGESPRVGTQPRTLVLDDVRYQTCVPVAAGAERLGIALLYRPSYSPNLDLIERLWQFTTKTALRGKYDPDFAAFRSAIEDGLGTVGTEHREALGSLMTLRFQTFDTSSVLAAQGI